MNRLKIGIIREGKVPPDSRVPLTPAHCAHIQANYPVEIIVAPSPNRCFSDSEYQEVGIFMDEDMNQCDILLGVKEVPISQLIDEKSYMFFSHTIKKQPHNRKLLQAILEKNIRLIDYEVLTDEKGKRLIAFGFFAGMVGAHNALLTYGMRTGAYSLKRMHLCHDYEAIKEMYKTLKLPAIKIVLTGTGRVGSGAASVLRDMGIEEIAPSDFLAKDYEKAVFTQLSCKDYVARKDGTDFTNGNFYEFPQEFKSVFEPYAHHADIMINGIYWDDRSPAFFTKEDMKHPNFRIKTIGDITCDIAPESSIPSTLKASTIADPIFGYDPIKESETAPFQENSIDMMTIDNLPSELPRDASTAFGQQFLDHILPELLKEGNSGVIERATIADSGKLCPKYEYLSDYVGEQV